MLYEVLEPPTPSGGGGKKDKNLGGGSVLLLIAFITGVVYLSGGLILNYRYASAAHQPMCLLRRRLTQRALPLPHSVCPFARRKSGELRAPHSSFWTSLPGLVSDGIQFSVCQCFGLGGGGSKTYQRIEPAGGSYGAL